MAARDAEFKSLHTTSSLLLIVGFLIVVGAISRSS